MGGNARILVIDDDPSVRQVLTAILEDEGYIVESVDTGLKAIQKTKDNFYNLALIDIRLPDVEGTKLLAEMKKTTPRMVKIIITGYPSLQNAIEAVNKGADAYVVKPFDMDKVLATIKKHLKSQGEMMRFTQGKVTEYIETRVKQLEAEKIRSR